MPFGDQVQSPATDGGSPSTLAGQQDSQGQPGQDPQQGQPAPNSDEGLKQAVQMIRQAQVQLMDLAKQFPAAASSLRQAESGLRSALRQIVANPGSPEPPSPAIGG